ncbi:MAG: HNH endonuclease [Bdellovibrionales bacterium]|nr:HNH endonuclease [Bdellovibrionales bacterium]
MTQKFNSTEVAQAPLSLQSVCENLSKLKNEELHCELKNRVAEERKLTHQVLQIILEIDLRKLYLPMACSSLFDYLVREIGYTPASAQRRIDAARMMQQVPELGSKIENGTLKLTQVSQVQQVLRLAKKENKTQLLLSEKSDLLARLENKTGPESELILAKEFNLSPQTQFKQKIQKDESVRIELTLSKKQMEILDRAKELLSHALPGATFAEVIESCSALCQTANRSQYFRQKHKSPSPSTESNSAAEVKGTQNISGKPIPSSVRKRILSPNLGCQFKDSRTGKICGSKHFLQVDHIKPRFAGGGNESFNLRPMCSSHNKFRYTAGC